jgi:hypothetical protein
MTEAELDAAGVAGFLRTLADDMAYWQKTGRAVGCTEGVVEGVMKRAEVCQRLSKVISDLEKERAGWEAIARTQREERQRVERELAEQDAAAERAAELFSRTLCTAGDRLKTMHAALKSAADRFREYERLHAAKPDPVKAQRNAEMAEMCERALATEG